MDITGRESTILISDGGTHFVQYVLKRQEPVLLPRKRVYYSRGQAYAIEWQELDQPLPAWFDPLMQGFIDLLTLPPDWNSYGAGAIDEGIVLDAMNFISGLLGPASPAPRIVPLSGGGLQLEWHRKGIDLEVVFDRDGRPFFSQRNRLTGEDSEHELPEDSILLRSIIAKLE
jgi:hypothetical protein